MTVVIQRPLRGSRIASFYPVKSLPLLSSLDSAFQLQEYISLLIRLDVHDVNTIVSVPGKTNEREKNENESGEELKGEDKEAEKERKSEIAVDEACWIYEQLRRLAQDLSHPLITVLQQECTRASCPEMKAGEWLYLCVAHGNDGAMEQCCAIDYILHTLDSATALLNSPRAFPSRLSIPQSSYRHFTSLARRLGRIFAHAYFHHREAFEQAEVESSLYARFLALTSKFELVPSEFLVIPTPLGDGGRGRDIEVEPPRLLVASVDHQREMQQDHQHVELGGDIRPGEWERTNKRGKSPPGLGSGGISVGDQSPRRYGRNRTDTMVFSEAFNVMEELSKRDLDDKQEDDPAQSDDVTPEAQLSEPQLFIDELEVWVPAPRTEESISESGHDTIELSRRADSPEASTHAVTEQPTQIPSSDVSTTEASEPHPSAVPASTENIVSDIITEDESTHVLEVKDTPKIASEDVAEEPSSLASHSSQYETSVDPDVPAPVTTPDPGDFTVSVDSGEAPLDVADTSEVSLSKETDQLTAEPKADPVDAEPEADEAAKATLEAPPETNHPHLPGPV